MREANVTKHLPRSPDLSGLVGAGLRHQHFEFLEKRPQTSAGWFEAISENFMFTRGRPFYMLEIVRQDYPIGLHGVSLSIAGHEEIDRNYLKKLKELIRHIEPFTVTDHLCWTGLNKNNLHNLLPFPYTEENLSWIAARVNMVQDYLGRVIALENLSAYLSLGDSSMTEWQFLRALSEKTGCQVLLDINNVYVNSRNQGIDARAFVDHIPAEMISHFHLAGHSDMGTHLFDTHSCPVQDPVWDLYRHKIMTCPQIPTLIEWDEDVPDFQTLELEMQKAWQHRGQTPALQAEACHAP